jgi:hypothetical protein
MPSGFDSKTLARMSGKRRGGFDPGRLRSELARRYALTASVEKKVVLPEAASTVTGA